MLEVKDKLISILEAYCPNNVYLQGTLNPDEAYPDTFITFFITDSEFDKFFDNGSNKINWSFSIMIYSTDVNKIDEISRGIIKDGKAQGFIPQGAGNDIISDEVSHTGWAIDFIYTEQNTIIN